MMCCSKEANNNLLNNWVLLFFHVKVEYLHVLIIEHFLKICYKQNQKNLTSISHVENHVYYTQPCVRIAFILDESTA